MARDRNRERDASQQSDREEQYGGMHENQGSTGQQRYAGGGYGQGLGPQGGGWQGSTGQGNWQDQQYGGGARGQGFGTGGTHQQHDPDLGREYGGQQGGQGRGESWGVGGHGSGSFGQSASDQGRNFGQGDYARGQDYGERFGRSGRSEPGSYGQQGFQGGIYGQQGMQGSGYGQQGFQGSGYGQQGGGSSFGTEYGRGYESGRQMGYVGRGPKGYRRSDDRIREDVSEELTRHPAVDASDIEVRVENGDVTLTGSVDSRQAKRMAEDCVEQCSGVKEVHNQLRVNRQGSLQGEQQDTQSRTSQARGRK
jgi:hypothetical protein